MTYILKNNGDLLCVNTFIIDGRWKAFNLIVVPDKVVNPDEFSIMVNESGLPALVEARFDL